MVQVVNRLEGSANTEVPELLQVLLQLLKSQLKIDFFRQQKCKLCLNYGRKIFETLGPPRGSLCHICAKIDI